MMFEEYLVKKKIDSQAFKEHERELWERWKFEFEQIHPNSFTAQKLYLINPIRLKYRLKEELPVKPDETTSTEKESISAPVAKPIMKAAKPVFKPKPKMD